LWPDSGLDVLGAVGAQSQTSSSHSASAIVG
jgi:hypothetical protein